MKTIFLAHFVIALALLNARAAGDKPEAQSTAVQPIVLKSKSVFDAPANARSPFWPIGWKPAPKFSDSNNDPSASEIPVTAFVVSSITMENNAKFAIINGKIMQEGQQFGLQSGRQTFQVTLKRIEDGRVIIGRRDNELVVPLRRK